MATKYSLKVLNAKTQEWTPVALFSDILSVDALTYVGRTLWDEMWDGADLADDATITDMDTGEVVWRYTEDLVWNYTEDMEPNEQDNIDDDCGFDPYMGCYTDDC